MERLRVASRYICVINRNRDAYQVPLALAEAGLLEAFVTDFYAPDKAPAWLPAFLARRKVTGLPRSLAMPARLSFAVQYLAELLRLPMRRVFPFSDRLLARKAGALARRSGQAVYAYHHYLPDGLPPEAPLVVFVFHPLPGVELPWLEADAARFPESAATFAAERVELSEGRQLIDWRRADAVVCTSSFTARSVIADGCDPAKISVIPYGLPPPASPGSPVRSHMGRDEGVRFLFVGQGVVRKGLHHLIRAWQASPPTGAMLEIVSYRMDPEIAALIRDSSICLTGYLSREELQARMAAADVFVMPSLVEGFGLVYLEALAQGCHVLGTANSGLPDLGLGPDVVTLVEPGNLDHLQAALGKLAERAACGELDPDLIADAASHWTQAEFRAAIARHAAQVLGDGARNGG